MSKAVLNVALKTALFASGKSQERIAKAARIRPQDLSHALRGRRELDTREKRRLAKVLGRSIEDLFSVAPPQTESAA